MDVGGSLVYRRDYQSIWKTKVRRFTSTMGPWKALDLAGAGVPIYKLDHIDGVS